ncbi:MAG TPA: choice-of-anchor D domain-containing protein [Candidatus Sulfotelmatobacter sp.]
MRPFVILLAISLACGEWASAQKQHSVQRNEIKHDVSPALRSIKPTQSHRMPIAGERTENAENEAAENRSVRVPRIGKTPAAVDTVAQTSAPLKHAPVAGLNFEGVAAPAGRAVPDTNGAVGATQYFQWVNVDFEIFDKSSGTSIYGPADASTIWAGFPPCNSTDDDDVVVEYDRMANVWVLEQHVAPTSGANYQCIAVSTSSDATGSYNRYVFSLPANFPDYPKISVWPDAYYLTMNEESNTTGAALGSYVCALNRASMLAGSTAASQCFQLSPSYNSLLPADLDGSILPPAGAPNYLMNLGTNSLNLWKFHVDWTNPANSTLTGPVNLPVAAFLNGCKASSLCVPQLSTTQLLDGIGDRLMFRLAYRHFADGHESLVATHSINTPAVVRWYEVQNPGTTPVVFQQSTFTPDSSYRWMGSIAMDQSGDIALGYSVSSSSMYPAIRYTTRLQSDPLNTMDAENSIIEGPAAQVGSNRWGDYSAMQIDPSDDCTFWFTSEYIPSNGDYNWHTRIASFSLPSCTSTPPVTLAPSGLYFAAQSVGSASAPQNITLTNLQNIPLNISSIVASANYLESDNCVSGSPIPPDGTCNISVTFKPGVSGTLNGQVTVTDDAPNGSQVVNMTGTGSAPAVTLAPTSLTFATLVNSTTASKGVKLTNSGAGSLTISSIVASGDFLETDTCVSKSPLAAGASCNINVSFAPTVTGTVKGIVTINDNGVNGPPHRIALLGTSQVTIAVSPATLTFPQTTVGNSSAAQTVTVTNNAATAQSITWTAGGDFKAVGAGSSPCGSTLNAGTTCTLSVTFSPTTNGTAGVVKGGLAVSDTATGIAYNPQSVSLSGSATGGPASNPLSFTPTSLNFSNVAIGGAKTGSAQILNVSGAPLTLLTISASGEYTVAGSSAKPCKAGLLLAANAKCAFSVTVNPTSGGSISGSVMITDNAMAGPTVQTYNLATVGFWPLTVAPASLSFPATAVGSTSSPLQVTATNYSSANVIINAATGSGDYEILTAGANPCATGLVLIPGAACTFGVTFSPTVTGTIPGVATFGNSSVNSPQVVSLTGTGQ